MFLIDLDVVIVVAEQCREPGGIARAAEVFHQQRIEQRRSLSGRQLEHVGEPHPDAATANAVPRALALGQVKGVGQASQHF